MPGPVAARKRAFAVHPRGVEDAAPYKRKLQAFRQS